MNESTPDIAFMNIQMEKKATKTTHEQIASLAHQLWEKGGRQHGRDLEDWLEAERRLNGASCAVPSQTKNSAPRRKPPVTAGFTNNIFRRGGAGRV